MESLFKYSKAVKEALDNNEEIVALESTIITHGMPYPDNLKTALNVEEIIRKEGVTPATIAIIKGKIHFGLEKEELNFLAQESSVYKASKSDLSYVLSQGLTASTTVASTIFLASLQKIKVFVTGGIGGVHRNYCELLDVSNDLEALAETSITVVSAGMKAILDIAKTKEYLETKGVTLIGYQTNQLPSFYSSESGLQVDLRLETPKAVANLIKMQERLQLKKAIMIANPIPKKMEIKKELVADYLKKAEEKLKKENVKGKAVTPFLLKEIVKESKGDSLKANISLIYHNAKLGALIAKALNEEKSK
ncbi:MAG: pseudouridine-5'-phosphate glycosidase [Acholeplasmatales bacterium]|jgi:pseudouridine-5'-phosphate glycosidase|nr:pseudouridine-5'-phosphate glycosidase [Acholeplasmataceae bacterium]MDY0115769.1 pseudouridine-5'-phosphate glycosidase [Acholeplasmatales bacterium]MCK9234592.1 pseudouridine-5'-phosphate glycosidase [Acholeplasmataceae bacterium]MCK9289657.1 pseudouridine-5'-phosphate glycosidase [Acholeplasmataceae bacterium]MCK9428163.1 pseudouridine-5'-phosphate glycosidase [Acholeplasmataceae bacterium]